MTIPPPPPPPPPPPRSSKPASSTIRPHSLKSLQEQREYVYNAFESLNQAQAAIQKNQNQIIAHLQAVENTMVQTCIHRSSTTNLSPRSSPSLRTPEKFGITTTEPLPLFSSESQLFSSDPSFSTIATHVPHSSFTSNYHPHPTIPDTSQLFRRPKVDFPRFNGENAMGWLAMAERYLRFHRIPPLEKVSTVASHFGPDASIWMNDYEQRNPDTSWERFVQDFLEHFGAGNTSDFKAALSHLMQITSVDDYIAAFNKLSCRAPNWRDGDLTPTFIRGLKPEIQHDVQALNPYSLSEAQCLARLFEAKLADIRAARSQFATSSWPHTTNVVSHQSQICPQCRGSFRVWTATQQRERRAKGLCFHCDETYDSNHVCKTKPIMAILECPSIAQPAETTEPLPEILICF